MWLRLRRLNSNRWQGLSYATATQHVLTKDWFLRMKKKWMRAEGMPLLSSLIVFADMNDTQRSIQVGMLWCCQIDHFSCVINSTTSNNGFMLREVAGCCEVISKRSSVDSRDNIMNSLQQQPDDWQWINKNHHTVCATLSPIDTNMKVNSDANWTSTLKAPLSKITVHSQDIYSFPAVPTAPSHCPQVVIMNSNKMRLRAAADNMGRCPGGYSRLTARQTVVVWTVVSSEHPSEYCGQLTSALLQVFWSFGLNKHKQEMHRLHCSVHL